MGTKGAVGATALLIALGTSAGCGGDDEVTVKDADGNSVTVKKGGDGVTITGDDGQVTGSVGSGKLPSDFPSDDVPLADGDIGYAGSGSGSGDATAWSVQMTEDANVDECFAEAVGKLSAAGFAKGSEASFNDARTAAYSSANYTVSVTATDADGSCSLVYAVGPAAE